MEENRRSKAGKSRDLSKNITFGKIILKNFINLNEEEQRLVLKWRNNEKIRNYISISTEPKEISLAEHREFIKGLKRSKERYCFLVETGSNYLGVISLLNVDFYNRRCLWGDYANPDSFHTGIGIILEYAAICLAFDVIDIHYLRCETIEQNKTALKLHEFFGFDREGVFRDYVYRDSENTYYNVVVMSIAKEKWVAERPRIEQLLANFMRQ
jgi:UDP-4-amino-4,6-dideoxy-N-acetyl-beta-L-altrosamine N-acetyltransferase